MCGFFILLGAFAVWMILTPPPVNFTDSVRPVNNEPIGLNYTTGGNKLILPPRESKNPERARLVQGEFLLAMSVAFAALGAIMWAGSRSDSKTR